MESKHPLVEFVDVHQRTLVKIASAIGALLEDNEYRVQIECVPPQIPEIITGATEANDYPDVDIETAIELAEAHNLALLATAQSDAVVLLAQAAGLSYEKRRTACTSDEERAELYAEIVERSKEYTKLTSQEAYYLISDDTVLSIRQTTIEGAQDIEKLCLSRLEIAGNGISERFKVLQNGTVVIATQREIEAVDIEVFQRKVQAVFNLREALAFIGKVELAHNESFGSAREINEVFERLWLSYVGTARENEVAALIDEAENVALARFEGMSLDDMHLAYLPSAENLDDYLELLGAN
jgi:hypothetical protein